MSSAAQNDPLYRLSTLIETETWQAPHLVMREIVQAGMQEIARLRGIVRDAALPVHWKTQQWREHVAKETTIEAAAKAIYDLEPMFCAGEYVDGFKVSPDGELTWRQIVEMANEFDDDPVLPYATRVKDCRDQARAALQAIGSATANTTGDTN